MHTIIPSPLMPRRPNRLRIPIPIAFGLLSVLVTTMAAVVLWHMYQASAVDGQLSSLASEVATQTLESRVYEKDFFLNIADPRARIDYLAKWQITSTALDQAIAAFAAAATTAQDQQQAARWREQDADYAKDFGQIARAVADGSVTSPQAANVAFTPFKANVRVLTESSVEIAERKAALERETSARLESIGARTIGLIGLLAAIIVIVTVVYSAPDTARLRRRCVECDGPLPLRHWFGGEHLCRRCGWRRLARLAAEAEERHRSE